MKINICNKEYDLETKVDNLLAILQTIKATTNNSLAFRSGCKSGVCGSCAVTVNGIEKLACKTTIKENDNILPLKNSDIIKDLVVDISNQEKFLLISKAFLEQKSDMIISRIDEKKIDSDSNCILCSSCFSSCPVYEVNPNFKGPFALTRISRYVQDKKESEIKTKIAAVQEDGVWSCTLCGNCNMVCPQQINIKDDIMQLRNISVQLGYNDPNLSSFDNNDFLSTPSFGFDPNGF